MPVPRARTGGDDGAATAPPDPEPFGTAALILAAASSAAWASAVPWPDPSFRPPGGRKTVLWVSALVTWAGVSVGNWALINAAIPATTALAALVLGCMAYPDGVAAMTPSPAAVSVTYGWRLVKVALVKLWLKAPTEITPGYAAG